MSSTTPGEGYSKDQSEAYDLLEKVLVSTGKTLNYYRLYIVPNKAGEPAYLNTIITYPKSTGSSSTTSAIWKTKLDMTNDYIYSCSHLAAYDKTATDMEKSAAKNGQTDNLMRSVEFVTQSPFVIDWDDESSTTISTTDKSANFYLIPLDSPEKYKYMGVLRMTTSKVYTDWW